MEPDNYRVLVYGVFHLQKKGIPVFYDKNIEDLKKLDSLFPGKRMIVEAEYDKTVKIIDERRVVQTK